MDELQEQYYKRKKERIKEFADNIPFNELFAKVNQLMGLDLKYNLVFKEDNSGYVYPKFESEDFSDKIGFLNLIFSKIVVYSFNSSIAAEEPRDYHDIDYSKDYPLYYWCNLDFSYDHQRGGSNGAQFMSAWYDEQNGWRYDVFRDNKR